MSVRKGIQLKSDLQISESFENAPAQLSLAGPRPPASLLVNMDVKTLTQRTISIYFKLKFLHVWQKIRELPEMVNYVLYQRFIVINNIAIESFYNIIF